MGKNTAAEIITHGFTPEYFRKADNTAMTSYINDVIAERTLALEGRLGTTLYGSTTSPDKDYVKRAELCLVIAELLLHRINIVLGNSMSAGAEINTDFEQQQRKAYLEEADQLIQKVVSGITVDGDSFASGVLETSHFIVEV